MTRNTQSGYDEELQTPHFLSRDELAAQVRRYVRTFNLNMITSVKIETTVYDQSAKRWVVKFETPTGRRTAVARHLLQATGIASREPYLPPVADGALYRGISVHSARYKNAVELRNKGVKVNLRPLPFLVQEFRVGQARNMTT